jgi:DNA-binding CsgD family transcriptional regulator
VVYITSRRVKMEKRIVELYLTGLSNRDVAKALDISPSQVARIVKKKE